ncbi:hypothetical protein ATC00_16645 [Sinorhizobium americanum]|nr:hypothetical protein ATC00_16645 [Sinorhizobium americanum]
MAAGIGFKARIPPAGAELLLKRLVPIRMARSADVFQTLEMVSLQQGGRDHPGHFLAGAFRFQPITVTGSASQFERNGVKRPRQVGRDLRMPQHCLDVEDRKGAEGIGNGGREFRNAARLDWSAILVETGIGSSLMRSQGGEIDRDRGFDLIFKGSHAARLSG